MTLVNMDTEEIFIIYVGTDVSGKYGKQDILTGAQVVSDLTSMLYFNPPFFLKGWDPNQT